MLEGRLTRGPRLPHDKQQYDDRPGGGLSVDVSMLEGRLTRGPRLSHAQQQSDSRLHRGLGSRSREEFVSGNQLDHSIGNWGTPFIGIRSLGCSTSSAVTVGNPGTEVLEASKADANGATAPEDQSKACEPRSSRGSNSTQTPPLAKQSAAHVAPAAHATTCGNSASSPPASSEERERRRSRPSASPPSPAAAASARRTDVACTAVEAVHSATADTLGKRLDCVRELRAAWASGDASVLAAALQGCGDDGLTSRVLRRLHQLKRRLSPWSLAAMLPVAQDLARADREELALVAVRFVQQALQISWPSVVRHLRQAGTPKAVWESCEAAVVKLQALHTVVKDMAMSVRVSRSNGPLLPLCRKLKVTIEDALSTAGRPIRGAAAARRTGKSGTVLF